MFAYAVSGLAASVILRRLGYRLSRISLEQLSTIDQRPPVLFLRSFLDDQVALQKPRRPIWHRLFEIGDTAKNLDRLLLEEATQVGPVVAIGVPGQPPPFGAARAYATDTEWYAAITELCNKACAIVIVIDRSPGVLWELMHIKEAGHGVKTIFLLAPSLARSPDIETIARHELAGVLPVEWKNGDRSGACARRILIGWYQSSDREPHLSLFTTKGTSWLSYMSALRVALIALRARIPVRASQLGE